METIQEVEEPSIMDADGMLLKGNPISEVDAIDLATWSDNSSLTDSSVYYPTPSFSSSEPHSTISEDPEDVRLAKVVWLHMNPGREDNQE